LGIENVDLYGGTRHSTAIALTEFATPEQIKRATMYSTNVAFERYYKVEKPEIKVFTKGQEAIPAQYQKRRAKTDNHL